MQMHSTSCECNSCLRGQSGDEFLDQQEIVKDLPPAFREWFNVIQDSHMLSKTKYKDASQLDPLVWNGPCFTYGLDQKTLTELLSLERGNLKRELDPVIFHLEGTKLYVLNLNMHKQFLIDSTKGLCCPDCNKKLEGSGYASSFRRVADTTRTAYMAYTCHRCPKCAAADGKQRTFMAHDPRLLKQYHPFIQHRLGLFITRRGAMTVSLYEELSRGVVTSDSFAGLSAMLKERQQQAWLRSQTAYTMIAEMREKELDKLFGPGGLFHANDKTSGGSRRPVIPYKPFDDIGGTSPIKSWQPSAEYLSTVYQSQREIQQPGTTMSKSDYQRLTMTSLGGNFLRGDHNHKLPKWIRDEKGGRLFNSQYNVMNEFGQIIAKYLCNSESLKELAQPLQQLNSRLEAAAAAGTILCNGTPQQGKVDMWVDCVRMFEEDLRQSMSVLDHILEDIVHGMFRVTRPVAEDAPLKGLLMMELSMAFFDLHMPDVELVMDHLMKDKNIPAGDVSDLWANDKWFFYKHRSVRRSVRPVADILQALQQIKSWGQKPAANGVPTLDSEAVNELDKLMGLVQQGLFTDPRPVAEMYIQVNLEAFKNSKATVPLPDWRTVRSTSQLESYHRESNALLRGSMKSAKLSDHYMSEFDFRYNTRAGIKNMGMPDMQTYEHEAVEWLVLTHRKYSWPNPHPQFIPLADRTTTQELFGVNALCHVPGLELVDPPSKASSDAQAIISSAGDAGAECDLAEVDRAIPALQLAAAVLPLQATVTHQHLGPSMTAIAPAALVSRSQSQSRERVAISGVSIPSAHSRPAPLPPVSRRPPPQLSAATPHSISAIAASQRSVQTNPRTVQQQLYPEGATHLAASRNSTQLTPIASTPPPSTIMTETVSPGTLHDIMQVTVAADRRGVLASNLFGHASRTLPMQQEPATISDVGRTLHMPGTAETSSTASAGGTHQNESGSGLVTAGVGNMGAGAHGLSVVLPVTLAAEGPAYQQALQMVGHEPALQGPLAATGMMLAAAVAASAGTSAASAAAAAAPSRLAGSNVPAAFESSAAAAARAERLEKLKQKRGRDAAMAAANASDPVVAVPVPPPAKKGRTSNDGSAAGGKNNRGGAGTAKLCSKCHWPMGKKFTAAHNFTHAHAELSCCSVVCAVCLQPMPEHESPCPRPSKHADGSKWQPNAAVLQ